MRHRVLLLPAVCVAIFAVVWSQPQEHPQEPVPQVRITRTPRPAAPQEVIDAQNAYKALGGGFSQEEHRGKPYYAFGAPSPVTVESFAKLPDPPFEYTLGLYIGPDTPPGALKSLARLRNLRRVNVGVDFRARYDQDFNKRRFNIVPYIAELAAVPNLEDLNVYSFTEEFLTDELAAVLPSFPSLRRISGRGPITDAGLKHLARCPRLEFASLQACEAITDAGLAHFAAMPTFRTLIVQDCSRLTAAGIRHFTKEPRLTDLAIGGEDMREDVLAEVEKITTLEELNLTTFRNQLTDKTLAHVGRLPRLRELILSGNERHTDTGLRGLAAAPALEYLYLSGCIDVTDAGFRDLARIGTLKELHISRADQMTDEGLKELSRLPKLETFSLYSAPRITDQGAKTFVERRRETLLFFALSFTPVTDRFTTDLPKLAPNLRQLGFYECKLITDQSVGPLSQLANLDQLSVLATSITLDGAETLRQRLPQCKVDGPRPGSNAGRFR
jgi:hypothetical protein